MCAWRPFSVSVSQFCYQNGVHLTSIRLFTCDKADWGVLVKQFKQALSAREHRGWSQRVDSCSSYLLDIRIFGELSSLWCLFFNCRWFPFSSAHFSYVLKHQHSTTPTASRPSTSIASGLAFGWRLLSAIHQAKLGYLFSKRLPDKIRSFLERRALENVQCRRRPSNGRGNISADLYLD